MATQATVAPPEGFVIDNAPPEGFVLDVAPPEGFSLDRIEDKSKGFINNLGDPLTLMKEESLPANLIKWMMGKTDAAREEQIGNPVKVQVSNQMSELELQGAQDTEAYQLLQKRFDQLSEIEKTPEAKFDMSLLKQAIEDDPGMVAAELVNAVAADPLLMITPLGWEKAAAAASLKLASKGKAIQQAGSVAAGAGASATLGAGLVAPISAAQQLSETGEVDMDRLILETELGAAGSMVLAGTVRGLANVFDGVTTASKNFRTEEVGFDPELSVGAAATMVRKPPIEIPGLEAAGKITDTIIDVTGGKAVTPIRKAGEYSPSVKKIADIMEAPEDTLVPVKPAHHERVSLKTGEYITKLHDSLLPVTRHINLPFRKNIDPDISKQIVNGLRGGEVKGHLNKVVVGLRKLMDESRDYAIKSGLDVGYIKDYFPRVYNVNKLKTDIGQKIFLSALVKHGIDPVDANDILTKIINNDGILELNKGGVRKVDLDDPDSIRQALYSKPDRPYGGKGGGIKSKNLEMSRKLKDITDQELEMVLANDLYPVMVKYLENTVKRSEWVKSFGKEGIKLNNLVAKGIRESVESGKPITKETVSRIYDLADALQGSYSPIKSDIGRKANTAMGAYQLIRTLPMAVLSSLSEPLVVFLRGDIKSGLKAVPAALGSFVNSMIRTVFKKFPADEATRALEEVGLGLDAALSERLTSAFGGEVTKATSVFFKANLLHDWTKMNRVLGNEAGKSMITGHLKQLAKGKSNKRYVRELAELGVDIQEGIKWIQRGARKTDLFYNEVKAGGLRFTNEVVMNPRPTNRPMWHSNPHFHLIAQLKGFQTTFGNTVVKRVLKELTMKSAYDSAIMAYKMSFVGSLMMLTAMYANELREYIKYGSSGNPKFKDEPIEQTLVRALDRTGFTGILQFAIDASLAHRFGSSGVASLAGPTVSQADEILEGVGEFVEAGKTNKIRREAANAIPFANIRKEVRDVIAGAGQ